MSPTKTLSTNGPRRKKPRRRTLVVVHEAPAAPPTPPRPSLAPVRHAYHALQNAFAEADAVLTGALELAQRPEPLSATGMRHLCRLVGCIATAFGHAREHNAALSAALAATSEAAHG